MPGFSIRLKKENGKPVTELLAGEISREKIRFGAEHNGKLLIVTVMSRGLKISCVFSRDEDASFAPVVRAVDIVGELISFCRGRSPHVKGLNNTFIYCAEDMSVEEENEVRQIIEQIRNSFVYKNYADNKNTGFDDLDKILHLR